MVKTGGPGRDEPLGGEAAADGLGEPQPLLLTGGVELVPTVRRETAMRSMQWWLQMWQRLSGSLSFRASLRENPW